jgi:hypothetical protein
MVCPSISLFSFTVLFSYFKYLSPGYLGYRRFYIIPGISQVSIYLYPVWVQVLRVWVQCAKIVPVVYLWQTLVTKDIFTQVTNSDMQGPQSQLKFLHLLNIGGRLLGARIFDILFNTSDIICERQMFFSDI